VSAVVAAGGACLGFAEPPAQTLDQVRSCSRRQLRDPT